MKRILIIFTIIIAICGGLFLINQPNPQIEAQPASGSNLTPFQLPLDGRLISGLDPSKLIDTTGQTQQLSNFSTLTNMEYTDAGIRSIRGNTKLTTSPIATYVNINNIFQFVKDNPSETHVLVQSYNSGDAEARVFRLSTATPTTGSFTATQLHTDATGGTDGRFSDAPIGHVVYCNSTDTTQVWGGLENVPGYFAIFDGADPGSETAWIKDYTEAVTNNLTDSENIATLRRGTVAHVDVGIGSVTAYVAARLPLQGIKFYIGTPNGRAGTVSIDYWNGSTLTAVSSLSDGTSSGGATLAQTGTISFDSTESTAKVRIIEGNYGYFYRLIFADATDTATITQVTVDEPFQPLVDFWDGIDRTILSAQFNFSATNIVDATTNVFEDEFIFNDSNDFDESTYMKLAESGANTLVTGTEFLYLGFDERMTGFRIKTIIDRANTVASTVLTVSYNDGDDWVATSALNDGTSSGGISFAHEGIVTWAPLAENVEFRTQLKSENPLFYYRIGFNQTITSNVYIYYITGIPVQKPIRNFAFSISALGRLWLFNDQSGERNKSIASNVATLNVFNGEDSGDPLFWGDDEAIQAAIPVHIRTTGGSRENILALKNNASYLLTGENPEEWSITTISNRIGCNAPLTLAVSSIGLEFAPLQSKQVAIWQGSGGIYVWDSTSIIPISDSISNYFDQTKPEAISINRTRLSRGFFETHNDNHYYHWLFSSRSTSTTDLDTELVFDLKRQGWFRVERTGNPLQAGTSIVGTDTGSTFAYGGVNTGELMRLDDGTDFDGSAITSIFETGDIPLAGSIMLESRLRFLRLIMAKRASTTNSVSVTHFVDTDTTGTTFSMSASSTTQRLAMPVSSRPLNSGTFHRFRGTLTTTNETRGLEIMGLGGLFGTVREVRR